MQNARYIGDLKGIAYRMLDVNGFTITRSSAKWLVYIEGMLL